MLVDLKLKDMSSTASTLSPTVRQIVIIASGGRRDGMTIHFMGSEPLKMADCASGSLDDHGHESNDYKSPMIIETRTTFFG